MLLPGSADFQQDKAALLAALAHAIAPLGLDAAAITLDGVFPSFAAIRVDLTGARLTRDYRPARGRADATGGISCRVLEIEAAPAQIENLPCSLSLRANDCFFAFGSTADGERAAILDRCSGGSLEVTAGIADIEAALLAIAGEAAAAHGAAIQSVHVSMEIENPRRLAITATATARAMMFSATLTVRGRLEITEDFNLQFSDLACTGDGMIANLAAGRLRSRLAELEARRFSLSQALPGGIVLTSIEFDNSHPLKIKASFGSTLAPP